jgi:hypothetical protein
LGEFLPLIFFVFFRRARRALVLVFVQFGLCRDPDLFLLLYTAPFLELTLLWSLSVCLYFFRPPFPPAPMSHHSLMPPTSQSFPFPRTLSLLYSFSILLDLNLFLTTLHPAAVVQSPFIILYACGVTDIYLIANDSFLFEGGRSRAYSHACRTPTEHHIPRRRLHQVAMTTRA